MAASSKDPRIDAFGRVLKSQTYDMLPEINDRLRDISKEFKLTASDVLEIVLNNTDWNALAPLMTEQRKRKEEIRAAAREEAKAERDASGAPTAMSLAKQLRNLTPERLAEVQAMMVAGS